jgi:hypothetical protein
MLMWTKIYINFWYQLQTYSSTPLESLLGAKSNIVTSSVPRWSSTCSMTHGVGVFYSLHVTMKFLHFSRYGTVQVQLVFDMFSLFL